MLREKVLSELKNLEDYFCDRFGGIDSTVEYQDNELGSPIVWAQFKNGELEAGITCEENDKFIKPNLCSFAIKNWEKSELTEYLKILKLLKEDLESKLNKINKEIPDSFVEELIKLQEG